MLRLAMAAAANPDDNGPLPKLIIAVRGGGEAALRRVFRQREVRIGRGANADVRLRGERISRQHCHLAFDDGCWRLHDDDSANGVYLDRGGQGAPFLARNDVIATGDRLYIASYRLDITCTDAAPAVVAGPAERMLASLAAAQRFEEREPEAQTQLVDRLEMREAARELARSEQAEQAMEPSPTARPRRRR